jgi:hypothetical protein
LIVGLRYCPRNWPIVRLRDSTLWLLAHRYWACTGERVPVHDTISPARRRAPSFLRNKYAARLHDATVVSFSLSPSLPLSFISRDNYCELLRKKGKIASIRIFMSFSDDSLIRPVALSEFFYHVEEKRISDLFKYFIRYNQI